MTSKINVVAIGTRSDIKERQASLIIQREKRDISSLLMDKGNYYLIPVLIDGVSFHFII
jgi:hypothetical protein